jgi:hypothetical protein
MRSEFSKLTASLSGGSERTAFAGCAEAQRRPQGLIEQVQLVAADLPPLPAHRVDCSLAAEFGPSPVDTPPGYYGLG